MWAARLSLSLALLAIATAMPPAFAQGTTDTSQQQQLPSGQKQDQGKKPAQSTDTTQQPTGTIRGSGHPNAPRGGGSGGSGLGRR